MKTHILIGDSTGRSLGSIKGYSVFNLKGAKLFEAKPETTMKHIIRRLLADLLRHEQ